MSGNILLVAIGALIGKQLAPTPELTTLPIAIQFIGLMLSTIPASMIMAKTGRKRGFVLGNCLGIFGTLLCMQAIYSPSFILYCIGTGFIGIGIGFGNLYRFAALEVCDADKKSQALSLTMAGGVIAAVIGPNLAIYSQRFMPEPPFLAAFFVLALLYILALVLISRITIPDTYNHDPKNTGRSLITIARQPVFIIAVASATIGYAVMSLVMTATPLAMQNCGFSFDDAAWVIEWHVLGMFLPSFFTGKLIQRWGIIPIMTTGVLFNFVSLMINTHGQSYEHFMIALAFLGIGWNFMFISATQLVTESYSNEEKAKTQALNEFIVFGVVTISVLASGWMEVTLGWTLLNISMIPVIIIALILIAWYQHQSKKALRKTKDTKKPT